jgi:hypothetical protein
MHSGSCQACTAAGSQTASLPASQPYSHTAKTHVAAKDLTYICMCALPVTCIQVWGAPTTEMQCRWLGERVATVDVDRAVRNVIHGKEDAGWGPNAVFRFPKRGGTGSIWKGVAKLLPADKQVSSRLCN